MAPSWAPSDHPGCQVLLMLVNRRRSFDAAVVHLTRSQLIKAIPVSLYTSLYLTLPNGGRGSEGRNNGVALFALLPHGRCNRKQERPRTAGIGEMQCAEII